MLSNIVATQSASSSLSTSARAARAVMTRGIPISVHSFMRTSLSFLDSVLLVVEYSPPTRCLYRSAMASGRPHATNDEALDPSQISFGSTQIMSAGEDRWGGTVSKYHPSSGSPSGYAAWTWRKRPSMLFLSLAAITGVSWCLVVSEVYSIPSSAERYAAPCVILVRNGG